MGMGWTSSEIDPFVCFAAVWGQAVHAASGRQGVGGKGAAA